MVGRRADIVRRTHRFDRTPGFCLSQDPYNLFLAESTSLHLLLLFEQNSSYVTSTFLGSGHLVLASIALNADPVAPSQTPIFVPSELIISYDRLGRDNVTIRAQQKGGGNDADYRYRARWGSYVRTVTSTKDIEVTILQPRRAKQPLRVGFFFVPLRRFKWVKDEGLEG